MKAIYFLIFIPVFFISCDKENISETFSLGLQHDFKIYGEYQTTDHSLKFTITEINDSRCPSDVVCVWEGKADVKIEVESPLAGSIVLSTHQSSVYTSIDTLGNYSFQLMDVSPYPISTKTIQLEDYKVTLQIEKL